MAVRETHSARPERCSRGSRVAHRPEDRCGSAIDRATLINARYRVSYLYGDRERPVDYVIDSRFRIRDGRIAEQQDSFATLTQWGFASMAFGFPTSVLAITPFLRPIVRRKALASLESLMQANGYR